MGGGGGERCLPNLEDKFTVTCSTTSNKQKKTNGVLKSLKRLVALCRCFPVFQCFRISCSFFVLWTVFSIPSKFSLPSNLHMNLCRWLNRPLFFYTHCSRLMLDADFFLNLVGVTPLKKKEGIQKDHLITNAISNEKM